MIYPPGWKTESNGDYREKGEHFIMSYWIPNKSDFVELS